jgi:predicted nucleic acid-binding protein
MTVAYLDSSAIVKLVVDEPESPALRAFLAKQEDLLTSVVGAVEARRIARRRRDDADEQAAFVLGGIGLIDLDARVVAAASTLLPREIRSLDAIHLASALELRPGLTAFVTYDNRLAEAARAIGLPVVGPA